MYRFVESFAEGNAVQITLPSEKVEGAYLFLEILRYAGVVRDVTDMDNGTNSYLIFPPKRVGRIAMWVEQNCLRIRSFGLEALPVKVI